MSASTEQRKLAAIMFTDMVGYSALAQRDEKLALDLLAEQQRLLRPIFPKFNGREIKSTGDGFLVEFASALEAAQCAIEIQKSLAAHNATVAAERGIHVRIGVHLGDVVLREADMFGDGVNIAARIEPLAEAGGICLSGPVFDQVANKLGAALVKLAAPDLKNIKTPMDVYRVVLPWTKQAQAEGGRKKAETKASGLSSSAGRLAGVAAIVLLAVGGGWWLVRQSGQTTKQIASSPTSSTSSATSSSSPVVAASVVAYQKAIAVLPFANISADKADEYLSDGISEEIITALSKVKGLKVPARTSCFAFKGKNEDIQKIGQQLRVATVLEGSISKVGNKLRVTAKLISITDGFNLWAETYDRALDDLLAIRTEVAARVAEALKGQLLGEEEQQLTKRGTENAEAHRLYLQGRYLWNRRTSENLKKAIKYFDEAIGKDPSYALAHSGLADCYFLLYYFAGLSPRDTMPKARAAATMAREQDNTLAEPRVTLAAIKAVFDWDWSAAEKEFQQATALNPNYATAHQWLANYVFSRQGRFDEAIAEMRTAQEIDPLSPIINANLGFILSLSGKGDLAMEILQKQIAFGPLFLQAHNILGGVYLRNGKLPEAIAALQKMHRLDKSGIFALENLGFTYARAGMTNDAQKILGQLLELQRQGYDKRVGIALVQHGSGDDERALESLEQAFDDHATDLEWLNADPLWKDLRPHPRVQAILKKMNLVK